MKLIQKSEAHSIGNPTGYKCLIADDTDMPKTGWSIELIGRIWSHVSNRGDIITKKESHKTLPISPSFDLKTVKVEYADYPLLMVTLSPATQSFL